MSQQTNMIETCRLFHAFTQECVERLAEEYGSGGFLAVNGRL